MTPRVKKKLNTACKWLLVLVSIGIVSSFFLVLKGSDQTGTALAVISFLMGTPAAFHLASQASHDPPMPEKEKPKE